MFADTKSAHVARPHRAWLAACALLLAAGLAAVALVGCSSDANVAAKYDGGTITEDAVTQYTADFRAHNSYTDDETWAQYLYEQGLTAKTWRERAIGALVEEALVASKAKELGISADQEQIDEQIASDKEAAGIAADDADAWASYLESQGYTVEGYTAALESASVEYQVLQQEVSLDDIQDAGLFDEYIQDNLVSRVVRKYRALVYASQDAAQAAINQLQATSDADRAAVFSGLLASDDSEETDVGNGGSVGWDIASDWGDVQQELNDEQLAAGQVSATPHEIDGSYYVFYCTDRYAFGSDSTYDSLPDADLQSYVASAAQYRYWSELTSEYLSGLRDGANVQVKEMPSGLPYDVDELIAKSE